MFAHIDIISTQFVAGMWVVAAIAVMLALRILSRSHRQRTMRFAGLCLVALAAIGLALADTVNAHYAYLPTAGDVRAALAGDRQWIAADRLHNLPGNRRAQALRSGAIVRLPMPADRTNGFEHSIALAYLPPQYFADATARFPVVYLLHGSPGRPADWFHAGGADGVGRQLAATGHPTILVAPQLSRSWTDDPECVDGAKERVETHVFDVVIPTVDATFRTIAARTSRVFAGMSAGGYCALNLGLRHRSEVATIVDLSGYTVPTHTGGVAKIFGTNDTALRSFANSPKLYAAVLTPTPATRVWLDTGNQDKTVVRQMSELAPVLTSRGVDVRWRVRSGGHTYWVWTAALQEAVPWAISGEPGRPIHNPSRPGPHLR
ncbi:MAG: alpha/beta hydrolase-fold protein [Actinomycetota bacterium]|nr:alpha/beta hydrolase-fold protein [Actinomycetota bacterium]